jgi:hypothetical protein
MRRIYELMRIGFTGLSIAQKSINDINSTDCTGGAAAPILAF